MLSASVLTQYPSVDIAAVQALLEDEVKRQTQNRRIRR